MSKYFLASAILLVMAIGCAELRAQTETIPISEANFVQIGGIDQWVTIRGDDRQNPILLHIHGGPGNAFSAFKDEFAPYEAQFTVVQWDQRGSGRTFGRYGESTPEVTLDRIVRDGIELTEYLEEHLSHRKIIVLGHSFGSIIATEMVQRAPEQFSVYLGTGQFASFQEGMNAQLDYLLKVADMNNDSDLGAQLRELRQVESAGLAQFFSINQLLFSHLPAVDAAWFQRLQSRMPEVMSPEELSDWQSGQQASANWLMSEVVQMNLRTTIPRLQVPVIVIQGRDDIYSPTDLAIAYFDEIESPQKELVIVEGAAHFPHLTHTEQFLAALVRVVHPLL